MIGRLLDQLVNESFQFVRSRQFTSGNFAKFCQVKHALVSFEQYRSIEPITALEVVVDRRQIAGSFRGIRVISLRTRVMMDNFGDSAI